VARDAAAPHRWWDVHMREILSGASTAFVLKGVSALLTFLLYVVIGRLLGAAGAGLYFLALTVTTIAAVLGRIGLDNTVLRFVAAHAAVGDWPAVKGVYGRAIRMTLAASSATALLVVLVAPWLSATLFAKPELTGLLQWMAIAIVPTALLSLQAQGLQGLKRIGDSSLVGSVGVPILTLAGVMVLAPRWGVVGATWAYALAATLTMMFGIRRWRARTPELAGVVGRFDAAVLLQSCIPLFWVSSFQLVIAWASTVSLGLLASSADVGVFGAANRTAMLISTVLMAVNSISAPKFAALYKQGDLVTLGLIAQKSAKVMALVASPVLAIFVLFPTKVMGVFGSQFTSGATVLSILAVGQFVNVVTGSVGWILIMCGHERLMRNNIAFCAGLSVALNLLLVPRLGVIGAAIATATALSVQMLIGTALVWQKLGVVTIPMWKGRGRSRTAARAADSSI
jgi:O-antigen/teichoic acid export membrane protein